MIRLNSIVRACTKPAYIPQALQESDTCGFCGVGACKTWVHVYPRGKRAPQVLSNCIFAPKGDERSYSVTLSLKTASKGSTSSPYTNVPLKCTFLKGDHWVWKYSMAHHVRTEHAIALAVRSKDPVALAFRAKYDANASEKIAVIRGCSRLSHESAPRDESA